MDTLKITPLYRHVLPAKRKPVLTVEQVLDRLQKFAETSPYGDWSHDYQSGMAEAFCRVIKEIRAICKEMEGRKV